MPMCGVYIGFKHFTGVVSKDAKGGDLKMHRERLETGALTDLVYREGLETVHPVTESIRNSHAKYLN